MPNPKSIAGALSKAVKGTATAAPKRVMPAASGFPRGSMDDLIHQITLGGKQNDPAIITQLQSMAGTNPALKQKLKAFNIGGGTISRTGANPMTATVQPPSGMMAGLMKHKGKATGGAAAAAGLGYMMSGSEQPKLMASHETEDVETPDPYMTSFGDDSGMAGFKPTASPKPRLSGGGMRKPVAPKLSGLTGQNGQVNPDLSSLFGASPEWEQTLGSVDDSLESSQGSLDAYNQSMQEPQQGGGFGDLMKKIGPILAALMAGKMMR